MQIDDAEDEEMDEEDYEGMAAEQEEQQIQAMEAMGGPLGHLVRALGGDDATADIIERMEAEGLGDDEEEDDDGEERMEAEFLEEGDEDGESQLDLLPSLFTKDKPDDEEDDEEMDEDEMLFGQYPSKKPRSPVNQLLIFQWTVLEPSALAGKMKLSHQ